MKSAFQDENFATFWHQVSGRYGQTYKQYVVDPCMFKLMGSLKNKVVLDLGCGNGYLGPRFIKSGVKKVILMDLSPHNIGFAKEATASTKATFIQQDATKKWNVPSKSLDIVFTDMMLNEVQNIKTPLKEAYRCLKPGGQVIAAVTHPAWDLYEFALEKAGKPTGILKGAGPYFFRGYSKFVMGTQSLKPPPGQEYPANFEVEHYQRPIEDYIDAFLSAGFAITAFKEPEIPEKCLREFPGYREMTAHPIGLVIQGKKK